MAYSVEHSNVPLINVIERRQSRGSIDSYLLGADHCRSVGSGATSETKEGRNGRSGTANLQNADAFARRRKPQGGNVNGS